MATLALKFQVECAKTRPGDAVFVCGSAPELGAWNPAGAILCTTSPALFPQWTSVTVVLPVTPERVDFKVVIMAADGSKPQEAIWEDLANRTLQMPKNTDGERAQVTATCTWGEAEVTYRTKYASGAVIGSGTGRPHGTEGVELSRIETASMFASMISELDDEGEGDASGEPQPAS